MIIRSNYRESKEEQFELEILGETTNMGQPAYFVRLLPKYQSQFQEGDKITKLRKCLIGDSEKLYSIKQETTIEQLSLF